MITPDWLEKVSDSLEVQKKLQDTILKDIVRRLAKTDFTLTESAKWQAEKLQQSGMLYDEIVSEIKKSFPGMEREIEKAFEEAEVEVFNFSDEVLEQAGHIPKEFKALSPSMKNIIYAAVTKTVNEAKNLVKTTASMSHSTFISACELAHQQIVSGAYSPEQATANAVKQAAPESGYIHYPTGARATIEAAIRRAVMTGVNQTAARLQEMRCEEMGCDLVEVSAHFGARPDHAEWQGQVYSRSGKNPNYDSFDVCGYGTVEGLCGANCRHDFHMFFEGISTRLHSDEELEEMKNATITVDGRDIPVYQATQRQRKLERSVRDEKKRLVGLSELQKATGNKGYSSDFDRRAAKLKEKEGKLDDWCRKTGLTYESSRVRVYGFGRSMAQRAAHGSKRELAKYTKYLYNKDGTIYVTDDWKNRKHPHIDKVYKPYAVIELKEMKGNYEQINRVFYDEKGKMTKQVHGGHHGYPKTHMFGNNGEHKHMFTWEQGKLYKNDGENLATKERIENGDII